MRILFSVSVGVFLLLVSGFNAHAQQVTKDVESFNQAFDVMLDDPTNIENTLRYAELATQIRDYEAAIPALERVLIFNPELHDIKIELGILYIKLNSRDVARTYFEDAAKTGGRDVQGKAREYLARL